VTEGGGSGEEGVDTVSGAWNLFKGKRKVYGIRVRRKRVFGKKGLMGGLRSHLTQLLSRLKNYEGSESNARLKGGQTCLGKSGL